MHILVIASFPESILRFRGPLILSWLDKGARVDVVAPGLQTGNELRGDLEALGIVVHNISMNRTGINPLVDLRSLWHMFILMRRTKPDIVLAYTIKPVIYGLLAAWMAKVPNRYALITGLGYAFVGERGSLLAGAARRLYSLGVGKAHKVIFQNPDDQALFREQGILAARIPSIVVNGSGIDLAAFVARPLPPPPMSFLMISRLLGNKGVREYASAARRIRASNPDVRFVLAGWIDKNPDAISPKELDAWIQDGGIDFLGRLEDVRPAIADCSVYVLPSYREGTPRTVLEAMALGRAIITTNAPGCRETVINGENGFQVPTKSVESLEYAMKRFIDNPELATGMGQRSRQIAEQKYDVNRINSVMSREMGIG